MKKLHIITAGQVDQEEHIKEAKKYVDNIFHQHIDYDEFANGETRVQIPNSVRGDHVTIVGELNGEIGEKNVTFSDKVVQLLLIKDAAQNHGSKTTNVIAPEGFELPFMQKYNETSGIREINKSGGNRSINASLNDIIKDFHKPRERLHIIGTQDTKKITLDIIKKLEDDIADNLSYEINTYVRDDFGRPLITLNKETYDKHVYVISDLNGKAHVKGAPHIKHNERLLQSFFIQYEAWKKGSKTINSIYTSGVYPRQDKPPHKGNKERDLREPSSVQFFNKIIKDNND